MSDKIITNIWYDIDQAQEAAEFYVSLLPDSRIDAITVNPADNPSMKAGGVLCVEFTLAGGRYLALNGGPGFPQTEAMSLMIETEDQAETDQLWNAFIKNGGTESQCGWLKDKWGISWQITPKRLNALMKDPVRGKAAMEAMLKMKKIDIAALEAAAAKA